jgi:hypothetical protein
VKYLKKYKVFYIIRKFKRAPRQTKIFFIRFFQSQWTEIRSISVMKETVSFFSSFGSAIAMPLYPFAVFCVLLYFFTLNSQAGTIRRADITEDRPTIVRLAKGRRTAIQFWDKPERVIPGSPGKVQIDFLGNDITVSPLANDPGNLLVYARGSRFVILFQMTSESTYDDVVKLAPGRSTSVQAIRLDQDTYHIAPFDITSKQQGKKTVSTAQALVKDGGKTAVFDDLGVSLPAQALKCGQCVYSRKDSTLVCQKPIEKVDCWGDHHYQLSIRKVPQ